MTNNRPVITRLVIVDLLAHDFDCMLKFGGVGSAEPGGF